MNRLTHRWLTLALLSVLLMGVGIVASAQNSFTLISPSNNPLLPAPPSTIQWSHGGADTYTLTLIHISTNRAVGVPARFQNLTPIADSDALVCTTSVCTFTPVAPLSLDDGRYSWTVEGNFGGTMVEASNAPFFFRLIEDIDIELLVNGSFETPNSALPNIPNGWTLTKANKDGRLDAALQARTGTASMRFVGASGKITTLAQDVALNPRFIALGGLKAGERVKVSGYFRTPLTAAGDLRLAVVYHEPTAGASNNGRDLLIIPLTTTNNLYQSFEGTLMLDGTVKTLRVIVRFTSPTGRLFVDDMSVVRVRNSAP